jgi:hypothetical protein
MATQPSYYWEAKLNSKNDPNWVDLGNGGKYNTKTFEVAFMDEGATEPTYYYDPKTNQTTFNGQKLTGKYDPYALFNAEQSDFDTAAKNPVITAYEQKATDKLNSNPFIVGDEINNMDQTTADKYIEKQYGDAWAPSQNVLDAYTMSNVYNTSLQRMKDSGQSGFFDQLGQIDFNEGKNQTPTQDAVSSYQQMMKDKYGAEYDQQVSGNPSQTTSVKSQPISTPTAVEPTQVSIPTTPVEEPKTNAPPAELDWKGLYDQLSQYMTGLSSAPETSTQTKQREEIGSFAGFTPATSYQKTSYKSSTPYSGKGA